MTFEGKRGFFVLSIVTHKSGGSDSCIFITNSDTETLALVDSGYGNDSRKNEDLTVLLILIPIYAISIK